MDMSAATVPERVAALRAWRPELGPCLETIVGEEGLLHAPLHDALLTLLERADRLGTGPYQAACEQLLELLAVGSRPPQRAFRAAVLANALGIVALGDAVDLGHLVTLVRTFGHEPVAQVQAELDALLRAGPGLPLTTALCRALVGTRHLADVLAGVGLTEPEAGGTAAVCEEAAFWLLVTGVDPDRPAVLPTDADDLRRLVECDGADAWRGVVAVIAAHPWGPDVEGLVELARSAGLPVVVAAIEWCATTFRDRVESAERLDVAGEIRRLIDVSGGNQRDFARYVGTSPSQLSAYVNGRVTPSAGTMVRIRRSAAVLAHDPTWRGGLHT